MKPNINISKSAFLRGVQCFKSLYLKKHKPELEETISDSQQAIFNRGHKIGDLAKDLFPEGTDLSIYIPDQFSKVFQETSLLISKKDVVIYEAGFQHNNLICFVDILTKKDDKYAIYEVKGSTSIKDVNLWDVAFQYHLVTSKGIQLQDVSIVYINNEYVRDGELDIHQLFVVESVLERIMPILPQVRNHVNRMIRMLNAREVPDISIGSYCSSPYDCSFKRHCWKDVPNYSVFNISRLSVKKKFELYHQGVVNVVDVPENFPLSHNQQLQVIAEKNKQAIVDIDQIRSFTKRINYPLYFLDFETFQPPIPLFDNSKPFQQIVFQYSLHILDKPNGELIHKEFLADATGDPRIAFIEQLVEDLESAGDIIVYNKGFEEARLREIARDFPQYSNRIEPLFQRVVDLMIPFSKKNYYLPEMQGSYSIKKVLPALVTRFSYDELNIGDGMTASRSFESLYNENDASVVKQVRKDLLAYCELDTLAMVEILKVLEEV